MNIIYLNRYFLLTEGKIMIYFLDKAIIFIFAAIICLKYSLNDYSVAIFCILIIISGLYYILDKPIGKVMITLGFIVLSFWIQEFAFFIPLILYDIIFTRIQLMILLLIPTIILSISFDGEVTIFFLMLLVFAIFSKYKEGLLEGLRHKYISYRDTTTEYNNLLSEKNKQLISNQNYELRVATLNERNRISKELHDSVGHLLSRSLIQVGALGIMAKEDAVINGLNELKESLSLGMDSVRETIHNIRDEAFDLQVNIQKVLKGYDFIPLHFEYNLQSEPTVEVKYCLISIIKEGLANIVKHSNATNVSITLLEHTSLYQLIIYDNGVIQNRDYIETCIKLENNRLGMGLSGMVDRVNELNGIINFSMDKGFRIFISIPRD